MRWFEDDQFWEQLYPYMFDEARLALGEAQVAKVVALAGVSSGTALDLCCGPGRHSSALARLGFTVTAVDRSAFLLEKARQRGGAIEFVQADMREFVRPAAFDLAVNLFTSFGYFDSREEDLQVLRNLHQSLKPGGTLVMDLVGLETFALMPARTRRTVAPDAEVFMHAEILPGWTRVRNHWTVVRGSNAQRFQFEVSLYSGKDLEDALRAAGFTSVQLFGSLDGTPYDETATRLVAVAR